MTLTRFLTKYVYFPLGGSKKGYVRTLINILIVFAISGIWHGAGMTFVVWGLLHGAFMVAERMIKPISNKLPKIMSKSVGWLLTFGFVNATWVIFRASDLETAKKVLMKMTAWQKPDFVGIKQGIVKWGEETIKSLKWTGLDEKYLYGLGVVLVLLALPVFRRLIMDSKAQEDSFKPSVKLLYVALALWTVAMLSIHKSQEFLYFQF
jgi:hypothetical protein